MPNATPRRARRTPEQRIAELQAQIAAIKARAEREKARKDPALRHISAAVRSIDKALRESRDVATRGALDEARATLRACLSLNGAMTRSGRGILVPTARRDAHVDPEGVLKYLSTHPGSRSQEIAMAMLADTKSLRPVLQRLKADGKARSKGQARATRYYAEP